jgi:hypothetical protein
MGGCEDNPFMKGLYLKRHDKGVLMLAKTIAAATMGRSTTFVDAGRHDELPDCNFGQYYQTVYSKSGSCSHSMGQVYC